MALDSDDDYNEYWIDDEEFDSDRESFSDMPDSDSEFETSFCP
jgi:hypothetical protein